MPEVLTKYPDIVIEILNDLPAINCGPNVPRKILKQCPPEQFCSLPKGELCIYNYKDLNKMTQLTSKDLLQNGGAKISKDKPLEQNFYLTVETTDDKLPRLQKIMEKTNSFYDGWGIAAKMKKGKSVWDNQTNHFFFLENYNDIRKVINTVRKEIKPNSLRIIDLTVDPVISLNVDL